MLDKYYKISTIIDNFIKEILTASRIVFQTLTTQVNARF